MPLKSVSYVDLPEDSELHTYLKDGDFCDCVFSHKAQTSENIINIASRALAEMPVWVQWLMKLRNRIVSIFGLKTGEGESFGQGINKPVAGDLRVGDKVGVFEIQTMTENEVILGENDKHLDFRISVFQSDKGVILSTWVRPHNVWGRVYLWVVMPFHRIITQHTVRRIASYEQAAN